MHIFDQHARLRNVCGKYSPGRKSEEETLELVFKMDKYLKDTTTVQRELRISLL